MTNCCEPKPEKKLPTSEEAQDTYRNQVRSAYAQVAQADDAGTSTGVEASCCGVSEDEGINTLISTRLGYSQKDLDSVPSGADMGLGCGNPKAIAALRPGKTWLIWALAVVLIVFLPPMKSVRPAMLSA